MKNIFRIIKKNLKLLIRAKSSALIIILAPLLIILLVGIAFDNANTYGLNIGVFSPDFNQNVESFLSKLSQKEFKVLRYSDEARCIEDIKLGTTHTCVVFPANLDFNSNQQQKITFYVDHSKINLVWMIMETLSTGVATRAKEISQDLTNILVTKLQNAENNINEKMPVLLEVKTDNNNVLVTAQEVDKNMAALNFDVNSFAVLETKNKLSGINNNLSLKIEDAKKAISAARSTVGSSGASDDEKSNAFAQLNTAVNNLNKAKLLLNSTESNQTLANILALIDNIQTKLVQTRTQITNTASNSKQKLGQAQDTLGQSLENLAALETMMDSLLTEIQSIQVTDPEAIANPIVTEIKPVAAQKTYLNYLFPSLMILVIMFIAILLGNTLVMMEKHSPALFRNFITPTRNITFIISTYLTNIFLVLIQLVIILGIALYFFSAQILPSLPMVVLILLLAATLFSLVGMAIGYLFTSEETGTLAAISFGSLCLFLSSTIVPLESMPTTIRQVAFYNPFVIAERLLRSTILFQPNIKLLANDFFLVLGYIFILFLFIWGSQHLASKHLFNHLSYKIRKRHRSRKANLPEKVTLKAGEVKKVENKIELPVASRTSKMPKAVISRNFPAASPPVASIKPSDGLDGELHRINSELSRLR